MDIIAIVIVFLHGLVFLFGLAQRTDVLSFKFHALGIGAILLSWAFLAALMDGGSGGSLGTTSAWYLILSLCTIGAVPSLTFGAAYMSGRYIMSFASETVLSR